MSSVDNQPYIIIST